MKPNLNLLLVVHRFAFPSAFVRYQVAIVMALDGVFLVSLIGGGNLFCSSRDFIMSSRTESTPYCTFTGSA